MMHFVSLTNENVPLLVQSINCRGRRLQIKIMLALVSLLIFTRKEHKLKFSCRKFIIFQVQRIFTELQNYCFTRREFGSINLLAVVILKESFKTLKLTFSMSDILFPLSISLEGVLEGISL